MYSISDYIVKLINEINELFKERQFENDQAVRDFQTDLYNDKVIQLNELRKLR